MSPIILTIFIGIVAYYLFQRLRFKLPPGPRAWPIIGNFNGLKPIQFRCFNEWAQTYGPIISVWFGPNLNVVVSNSELAKQVLRDHDQDLSDRFRIRSQAKYSQAGDDFTWADYGPHYVKMRKMCTLELFSAKRIEALRPIRDDEVTAMVAGIYRESTLNQEESLKGLMLRKYLGGVALNNITRLVLGKRFMNPKGELDAQGKEFRGIVEAGRILLMKNLMAEHIPLLRWLQPTYDRQFQQHTARVDRLTMEIMEEHTHARLATGNTKQHFTDAMLSLREEYGLTDDNIIGVLWNMITAGMDTTAISVEWAMAELLKNPRCIQKAQEELDKVIGRDRAMTEDDISDLPYLQAIVKEALRLHPSTPLMLPHRAKSHVKIGGYDIPKGTTVYVNVWAIARDPNVWADPIAFKPERFLGVDFDIMKGHDYKMLPFGAGRRICIGAQLGLKMVTCMLGRLLHQFNWSPPEGVKPEGINMLESDSIFVTYMALPLKAQPSPRLSPNLYQWIPMAV